MVEELEGFYLKLGDDVIFSLPVCSYISIYNIRYSHLPTLVVTWVDGGKCFLRARPPKYFEMLRYHVAFN